MNLVAEQVMMRNDAEIERLMGKIRKYQEREAAGQLPSLARFEAEKLYNSIGWNRMLAMASIALGIVCFLLFCFVRNATLLRWLRRCLYVVMVALGIYLTVHIALRWYVSGHVPLSNGYETMQFMSWGRYWGWDPKEVWALITMLIYAALIHAGSLPMLRRPMVFHVLTIVAFLSVVVTYFGVNFLLGGMHSYA